MNLRDYATELLPRLISYKLARAGLIKPSNPIVLTFSVTAACQSRCKTCNIGRRYLENPEISKEDLTLDEIERAFKSLGHIYFFNISGGEPFLRRDLPGIVELACRYLKPKIIHIPTNALMPRIIEKTTEEILSIMDKYLPRVPLTIKPSIDGVGELHDEIRGVKGNFERLMATVKRLMALQERDGRLHVELGTVVSNYNLDHLDEIEDFVHSLGVESYRNEIAEQRAELLNIGDPITPSARDYERLMKRFSSKIKENISHKRKVARITEGMRLVYYELASEILREGRQVIPCYAGISNVHLNYDGEVWPCCVLGYDKPMGDLRRSDYDFQRILRSDQAREVRRYIKEGNCACPMANQMYSNILCDPRRSIKVIGNVILLNLIYYARRMFG
ncbi:radical SAM protein [Candidatus Poribacteria bacterium]|nr:MAG: radical SAM protein [Candidatus Poribacteria bacterium]